MLKLINLIFGFVLRAISRISELTTIPQDKIKHFLGGGVCSSVPSPVLLYNDIVVFWAILSAVIIGAGKELIYDKWYKKGTPSWGDFIATAMGGVVVTVIIDLIVSWVC